MYIKRLLVVTCTRFLCHKDLLFLFLAYDARVTKCLFCVLFDVQHVVSIFFFYLARLTIACGSNKLEEVRCK